MRFFGLIGRPNISELKATNDIVELTKALHFPDDDNVRFEVAAALGGVGDARCVEPLIDSLNDTHRIRKIAIRSLGKIGDSRAISPLVDALKDESWEIRSMAAKSLGTKGDSQATGALIFALENDTETVRWYIIQALANITGENFEHRVSEWQDWYQQNNE